MSRVKTLQALFKRYRRPGDIVFAWGLLIITICLLSQLWSQTTYRPGTALFAQPRFWPAASLISMAGFAAFHLLGSALSERIEGRWREVLLWAASLEYAGWFIIYAIMVPMLGYLPTTILFALGLTIRVGYRSRTALFSAVGAAVVIVLLFKTLLQVRLPAGQVYQYLPDGLRQIMLTYF
ncbi:tripartite tricarboxylate transporter TctB family protein [Rhodophyticola sp. CCM32]|uniref:tripartite tricarboxylate transporter TctB family protein n=1 Tax=Rhodophyticola sp. CCM32 TaxID=2916397 RepID=UPI00107F5F0A|nr:tripartite tricarboxylate transporter TctB family protein [Rhodophyticola sp. CCM32]QBY01462.1 tripartite tricarboxylate transporter TctB family protein [Rhodophyticola sp. CCM32]